MQSFTRAEPAMASLTPDCFWQHEVSTETTIGSSVYQERHHFRLDLTEGERCCSAVSHKYLPWFKPCQSSEHLRNVHLLNSPSTSSKMLGVCLPKSTWDPEIKGCRPPKGFPKSAKSIPVQLWAQQASRYPYPAVLPSVHDWIQISLPSLMVRNSYWTKLFPVMYFPLFTDTNERENSGISILTASLTNSTFCYTLLYGSPSENTAELLHVQNI